jgi:branched-chain amino acid transport system substrate-binding protein
MHLFDRHLTIAAVAGLSLLLAACQPAAPDKVPDRIRVGYAISLTGPYEPGATTTQTPNYRLWANDVNARGGIMLSKFGKRVPIELIELDDQSDVETAVRLDEQLATQDRVDLLLPPWGTAMQVAVAPVFNKYQYPQIAATAQSLQLREKSLQWPYAFWFLPQPDELTAHLETYLKDLRDQGKIGKRIAILSVADDHGIEMTSAFTPLLANDDFQIVYSKSYPLGATDLAAQIREVQQLKPDSFIAFSYPDDTFLITRQSAELGFNPAVFYTSIGTAFPAYHNVFGTKTEGVLGAGGWVSADQPGAKEWAQRHIDLTGQEPDRWAGAYQYAGLQVLEKSIEQVGSLNRKAIRDVIAGGTFDTIIGPVSFKGQFNIQHPGYVGQWQSGEFKAIGRADELVVPRPG